MSDLASMAPLPSKLLETYSVCIFPMTARAITVQRGSCALHAFPVCTRHIDHWLLFADRRGAAILVCIHQSERAADGSPQSQLSAPQKRVNPKLEVLTRCYVE